MHTSQNGDPSKLPPSTSKRYRVWICISLILHVERVDVVMLLSMKMTFVASRRSPATVESRRCARVAATGIQLQLCICSTLSQGNGNPCSFSSFPCRPLELLFHACLSVVWLQELCQFCNCCNCNHFSLSLVNKDILNLQLIWSLICHPTLHAYPQAREMYIQTIKSSCHIRKDRRKIERVPKAKLKML
jgi:hypothetical protein